jgi:hypothetical protein
MDQLNLKLEKVEGNELTIRTGSAVPVHVSPSIKLEGVLANVVEWIEKRGFVDFDCSVVFSLADGVILFSDKISEVDFIQIKGELKLNKDIEKIGLNSGKSYTPYKLSQFIRMNRHFFTEKSVALSLESILKNFEAKVDGEISQITDTRGNKKHSAVQKVMTNLPENFELKLPVFIGQDVLRFLVEVDINPDDLSCTLVSPDLKMFIESQREELVNEQIELIKSKWPQIPVLQY